MGLYTEHWARHGRHANQCTLQALLVFGPGVPLIALVGYLLDPLAGFRVVLLMVLIAAWLATIMVIVMRGSRVECPRCLTRYARGRVVPNCPGCGLRMFQENP